MSDRALKMLRIYLDARADEEAEWGIDTRRVEGEVSASARRMTHGRRDHRTTPGQGGLDHPQMDDPNSLRQSDAGS